MRQGQQNRRGRGRGRKPQNPLARNYESNGPDVKIRGTAAHIAEKYMSLARDALASGDMVTAESYLQHAEHYNRIIMAAQSQMGAQHGGHQGEGPNGGGYRPRWNPDATEDEGGEFDSVEGGGDIRSAGGGGGEFRQAGEMRQGGGETPGSQDRERHEGNREHHGRGREQGGGRRHGGNGSEASRDRDANGSDQAEGQQPDETTPDPVS
jgi:Domain of unknown function (DUF4167)